MGPWNLKKLSVRERFDRLTCPEPNSGCILWMGTFNHVHGYGTFVANRDDMKHVRAHRLAWMLEYGDIPDGMNVLHRCDVRLCVNVRHLFLGTFFDNARDMAEKKRGITSSRGLPFGVAIQKRNKTNPYQAQVHFNSRTYYLGSYSTSEEAAAVADAFRNNLARAT